MFKNVNFKTKIMILKNCLVQLIVDIFNNIIKTDTNIIQICNEYIACCYYVYWISLVIKVWKLTIWQLTTLYGIIENTRCFRSFKIQQILKLFFAPYCRNEVPNSTQNGYFRVFKNQKKSLRVFLNYGGIKGRLLVIKYIRDNYTRISALYYIELDLLLTFQLTNTLYKGMVYQY